MMTDILFVTISDKPTLQQEINGSLILATKLLQDGFTVKVLRFGEFESWEKDYAKFIQQITTRILELSPKCVSFYSLCATYHIVLRIAQEVRLRNPNIHLILGGPQATLTAEDTLKSMDYIDYVCTGEGENTVVPFFRGLLLENGRGLDHIPGLYYRCGSSIVSNKFCIPPTDLETLPYWDDRLLLPEMGIHEPDITSDRYCMPIDTGRGCPYNCTFCSTSLVWNRKYRLKSAERILQDINYFHEKYGIRSFDVAHDAFTANAELVSELCDHIKSSGLDIRWKCSTRIDCISKELVLKMKDAGLSWISLGIESGSQRMQERLKKRLDLSTVKPMVQFLQENKIDVTLLFMYGFPEETEEDLNQTLELLFSLMDMGRYHLCMLYCLFDPKTELIENYYDQLFFDPNIQSITDGVFGFKEEVQMIANNKPIFPFFYHLDTPVRNNYQCLHYLTRIYEAAPDILSHIRKNYQGNNLQFYRDFYEANRHLFVDFRIANQAIAEDPLELIVNLLKYIVFPNFTPVHGLIAFKKDILRLLKSTEDISIQNSYSFCYGDYRKKLPLMDYSPGVTSFLMKKENQKLSIRILPDEANLSV